LIELKHKKQGLPVALAMEQQAKDAARYRWLRAEHESFGRSWHVRKPSNDVVEIDLDAAIDAAMAEAKA